MFQKIRFFLQSAYQKGYAFTEKKLSQLYIDKRHAISVWDVVQLAYNDTREQDISTRAAALAYNYFFAMFPALIFLFTLIPFLPHIVPGLSAQKMNQEVLDNLKQILPKEVFTWMEETIKDIITHKQGNLLSIGAIMTLYMSTRGITTLMSTFRVKHELYYTRNYIQNKLTAISITAILFTLFIIMTLLLVFWQYTIIPFLSKQGTNRQLLYLILLILNWSVIFGFIYLSLCLIYYIGPAKKGNRKFFSVGAGLSTVLITLSSVGFKIFLSYSTSYNKIYGSLATLIIVLIWFYTMGYILILGFEVNHFMDIYEQEQQKRKKEIVQVF
ncbi:MAG: YihY/virulence factor BrkB family protein [Bacteroidia bacterium]|nr:YihY/virulence factor BrkB family protein [Bacteroidia bacterium]MDW8302272.1 YihY/virulence factor BrkB family protein [Bacteroidia bacterium]